MAVRTSTPQVEKVMSPGKDYNGTSDLNIFIIAASPIVDYIQSKAAAFGRTPLTEGQDSQAQIVEAYLAAWAYCQSDQQFQSDNAGRSSANRKGTSAMGLNNNNYGQAAMTLDTTGILRAMEEGRIATAAWVGRPPSEQTRYSDRR